VGVLLSMPSLLCASALKLFSVENRTVGVDPLISFMIAVAASAGFGVSVYLDIHLFESVGKGALKPDAFNGLLRFLKLSSWGTYIVFNIVTCAVYVVGIVTGVTDPETSIMRFMLVIRNVAVICCKFKL